MSVTNTVATGRVRLSGPGNRIPPPPARRRWWRDLAGSAAILSVVAVTALWLANGGIRNLQGSGEPSTTLGPGGPQPSTAATPGVVPDTPRPSGSARSGTARTLTVNGSVVQTRWGPVQVQVKIANAKITDVRTLQRPSGNDRDEEINAYAIPQLRIEVLNAQSASIDAVSGASVTSGGYVESLQAALDAAHFG